MKVLYGSQELREILENGFIEPQDQVALTRQQNNELKENHKKDKKAYEFPQQIQNGTWNTLQSTCQVKDKVKMLRLQALRSEFYTLNMKNSELMEEYFNRVLSIINQLKVNGEQILDQRTVGKILSSMTRKFEHVVVAIENQKTWPIYW